MWRCDVKMRRCEDEKMKKAIENVKMWGCEDVRMRRCEDVKIFDRPPLLEVPFSQTLSGKKHSIQWLATFLPFRAPASSFCWLFLFFWSSFFFSSLTFSTSAFSSVRIVGSLTSQLPSIMCIYFWYITYIYFKTINLLVFAWYFYLLVFTCVYLLFVSVCIPIFLCIYPSIFLYWYTQYSNICLYAHIKRWACRVM